MLENFSTQQEKINPACPTHGPAPHWLPIGRPDIPANLTCSTCKPPPSRAFVARWAISATNTTNTTGTPPGSQDRPSHARTPTSPTSEPRANTHHTRATLVACERIACHACRCRWINEVDGPAGLSYRCWSCKRDVPRAAFDAATMPRATEGPERATGVNLA